MKERFDPERTDLYIRGILLKDMAIAIDGSVWRSGCHYCLDLDQAGQPFLGHLSDYEKEVLEACSSILDADHDWAAGFPELDWENVRLRRLDGAGSRQAVEVLWNGEPVGTAHIAVIVKDRFMGCPLPCGHAAGDFAFPGLDWPELDEIAGYLKGRR